MYTHQKERNIEAKCYEFEHVEQVLEAIRNNFSKYYDEFIKSEAGNAVTADDVKKIAGNLGVKNVKQAIRLIIRRNLLTLLRNALATLSGQRKVRCNF